ncbi:hypothetical protein [Streptomyces sp. TRM75561]|uniref:WXG100-like domain-containing protein n=1 Tax=Streptomyces sp. TRM75561 TaxID=2975269 RepID=UPI0024472D04|nr:hypothetical protein [Streptomyces sp. TRM75561]MDH3039147.1 hypothetical protein [Streptomyces sp. TRM75561]
MPHFDDSLIRELGRQWIDNGQRLHDYVTVMDSGMASMNDGWTGKAGEAAQVVWSGVADHNVRHALLEAGQVAQDVGNAIIAYADELQKTVEEINRAHMIEALATIFGLVLGLASFGIAGLLGRLLAAVADIVAGIASRISAIASAAAGAGRAAAFVTDAALNAALTLGTDIVSNLMASKAVNAPLHVDWQSEGMNVALGVWMGAGMGGLESAQGQPNTAGRGLPQVSPPASVPKPIEVKVSTTVESWTDPSPAPLSTGTSPVNLSVSSNLGPATGTHHVSPANAGMPSPVVSPPRVSAGRESAVAPVPENVVAVGGQRSQASAGHPHPAVADNAVAQASGGQFGGDRAGQVPPAREGSSVTPVSRGSDTPLDSPPRSTNRESAVAPVPENVVAVGGQRSQASAGHPHPAVADNAVAQASGGQFGGDRAGQVPPAREGSSVTPVSRGSNTPLDTPSRGTSEGAHAPVGSQDAATGGSRGVVVGRSGVNEAPPVSTPTPRPEGIGEAVASNAGTSRGALPNGGANAGGPVAQPSGPTPHNSPQPVAERGGLADGGTGRSVSTRGPDHVREASADTGTANRAGNRPESQARPHNSSGRPVGPDGPAGGSQTSAEPETSGVRRQADRPVEFSADHQPPNRQRDIGSVTTAHTGSRSADGADRVRTQDSSDGQAHSGGRPTADDAHTSASRNGDASDISSLHMQDSSGLSSDGPTKASEKWTDFTHAQARRDELVVDSEARVEALGSHLDDVWRKGFDRYVAGDNLGVVDLKFDSREVSRAKWDWRRDITQAFRSEVEMRGSVSAKAFDSIVQGAERNAHKYLERSHQAEVLASNFKAEVSAYRSGGADLAYRRALPEFDSIPWAYTYDSKLKTFVRNDSKAYGIPAAEEEGPIKIPGGPHGDEVEVFVTSEGRDEGPVDYFRDKTLDFNPLETFFIQKMEKFNDIFSSYLNDQNMTTLPADTRRQLDGLRSGLYDDLEAITVRELRIETMTEQKFNDIVAWQSAGNGGRDALGADFVTRIRGEFQRDLRAVHDRVYGQNPAKDAHEQWDLATARAIDDLPGRIARERFIQSKLSEETAHAEGHLSTLGEDALTGLGEAGRQRVLGEYLDTVRDHARNHYTAMMDEGRTASADIEAGWAGRQSDVRAALPRTVRHEAELQDVVIDAAHDFHGILRHPESFQAFRLNEDTISRLGNDFRTERVHKYDELFAPEGHKADTWLAHESAFGDGFQARLGELREDHIDFPTRRKGTAGSPTDDHSLPAIGESRPARNEPADIGTATDGEGTTPQTLQGNGAPRSVSAEGNGAPQRGKTHSDAAELQTPSAAQQLQVTTNSDTAVSSGSPGFRREHTAVARSDEQNSVAPPSRQEQVRSDPRTADVPSAVRDWLRSNSEYTFSPGEISHAHQELLARRPSGYTDLPLGGQATELGRALHDGASHTARAASAIVLQNSGVFPHHDEVRQVHQELLATFGDDFRRLPAERQNDLVAAHVLALHDLAAEDGRPMWTAHTSPVEMLAGTVRQSPPPDGRSGQDASGLAGRVGVEESGHGAVGGPERLAEGESGDSLLSHEALFGRDARGFIDDDAVYLVHGETVVSVPRGLERAGGEGERAVAGEEVFQVLLERAGKAFQKLDDRALLDYQAAAQSLMDGRHRALPVNMSNPKTEDDKLLENIRSVVAYQLYLDRSSEGEAAERNAVLVSEWLRRVFGTAATDGFVVKGGSTAFADMAEDIAHAEAVTGGTVVAGQSGTLGDHLAAEASPFSHSEFYDEVVAGGVGGLDSPFRGEEVFRSVFEDDDDDVATPTAAEFLDEGASHGGLESAMDGMVHIISLLKPLQEHIQHVENQEVADIELAVVASPGAARTKQPGHAAVAVWLPGSRAPVTLGFYPPGMRAGQNLINTDKAYVLDRQVRVLSVHRITAQQLLESYKWVMRRAEELSDPLRFDGVEFVVGFVREAVGNPELTGKITTPRQLVEVLQEPWDWADKLSFSDELNETHRNEYRLAVQYLKQESINPGSASPYSVADAQVWAEHRVAFDHQRPLVQNEATGEQQYRFDLLNKFGSILASTFLRHGEAAAVKQSQSLGITYGSLRSLPFGTLLELQEMTQFIEMVRPLREHLESSLDDPRENIELGIIANPGAQSWAESLDDVGHAAVTVWLPGKEQPLTIGFYPTEGMWDKQGAIRDDAGYALNPRVRVLGTYSISAAQLFDGYRYAMENAESKYNILKYNCVVFAERFVSAAIGNSPASLWIASPHRLVKAMVEQGTWTWADGRGEQVGLTSKDVARYTSANNRLTDGRQVPAKEFGRVTNWARYRVAFDHQRPLMTGEGFTPAQLEQVRLLEQFTTMVADVLYHEGEDAAARFSRDLGRRYGTLRITAVETPIAETSAMATTPASPAVAPQTAAEMRSLLSEIDRMLDEMVSAKMTGEMSPDSGWRVVFDAEHEFDDDVTRSSGTTPLHASDLSPDRVQDEDEIFYSVKLLLHEMDQPIVGREEFEQALDHVLSRYGTLVDDMSQRTLAEHVVASVLGLLPDRIDVGESPTFPDRAEVSGGRLGQDDGLVEEDSLLSYESLLGRDADGLASGVRNGAEAVAPRSAVASSGGVNEAGQRTQLPPSRTPDDSRSRSRIRNRLALGQREWREPVADEVTYLQTRLLEHEAGSRALVMGEKENEVVYTWAINVLGKSVTWTPYTPDSSWEKVASLDLDSSANLINPPQELVALSDEARNFDATNFCSVTPGRNMEGYVREARRSNL